MNSFRTNPLHNYSTDLGALARFIDTLCVGASFLVWPLVLGNSSTLSSKWLPVALISMLIFLIAAQAVGLYRSWRGEGFTRQVAPVFSAVALTAVGLLLVSFGLKQSEAYSRTVLGLWLVTAPLTVLSWRAAVAAILTLLRQRGFNIRRVAILGATAQGAEIATTMLKENSLGLKLIGIFDDRSHQGSNTPPWQAEFQQTNADIKRISPQLPVSLSGNFKELLKLVHQGDVDMVYITLPMRAEERTLNYLSALSDTTASVYIVPDFFVFDLLHAHIGHIGRLTTLSVFETPFIGWNGFVKRTEDIVASFIILAVISVPMLIIALMIKLTSPGPVLFKQHRYGVDGVPIEVWKFRSMTVMDNGKEVMQATKNDVRITPFGAFLRRTSLDELPQFFNVLSGSMSIVGPRPHAVAHNEQYRKLVPGYMLRHKIKPGVTGWAQVNGWRGETDTLEKMEKRVKYDLDYIRNWSVFLDIKIIFMTIFKGFIHKNAY